MKNIKWLSIFAVLIGLPAFGHHGIADYDTSELILIEGKVTGYELNDPHSYLFVEVIDQSGKIMKWQIEGGASSGIARAGLSKEFLSSNPLVTIKAFASIEATCAQSCKAVGQDFDFHR